MSQSFADQYGTELTIAGETALPGCARVWVSAQCGTHVPAETFPRLIAALFAAAGKPEPVILERPEIDQESIRGVAGWRLLLSPGGQVVSVGYGPHACEDLSPAEAREVAALLAAFADLAEADEPDPAEVSELAALLHHTHCTADDCGLSPTIGDLDNARAALSWMKGRKP